ncbi:MAG: DUF1269 domain-containing protein [Anaerolineae bacterium]
MSDNKNEHVVIALFDNQQFADYGIDHLKQWDRANDEVKIGVIGTIFKKGDKVKTHVAHKTGGGAKVGLVLGVIAAILSGGTTLIAGAVAGGVAGGVAGSFFKKSLHLTKEETDALGQELDRGRVAVVVTCDEAEVEAVSQQLTQWGGDVKGYAVPTEAVAEAAAALPETTEEPAADEAAAAEATAQPAAETTAAPEATAAPAAAPEATADPAPPADAADKPA